MKYFFIGIVVSVLYFVFIFDNSEKNFTSSDTFEPKQFSSSIDDFKHNNDFIITPKYSYEIQARVLSKKGYSDFNSKIAPYDLALGWDEMSLSVNTDKIDIWQRKRWYFWQSDNMPIKRRLIELNSANHHIIHKDDFVKDKMSEVDEDDIVYLKGYLVNVKSLSNKSWYWNSSTSRTDVGDGACEVFFVEDIKIIK